jgi:hypothetical protein
VARCKTPSDVDLAAMKQPPLFGGSGYAHLRLLSCAYRKPKPGQSPALFGAAVGAALVIASHHDDEGLSLHQKIFDVMLTWLLLVPVAYAVGMGVAKACDMWRSR